MLHRGHSYKAPPSLAQDHESIKKETIKSAHLQLATSQEDHTSSIALKAAAPDFNVRGPYSNSTCPFPSTSIVSDPSHPPNRSEPSYSVTCNDLSLARWCAAARPVIPPPITATGVLLCSLLAVEAVEEKLDRCRRRRNKCLWDAGILECERC